MYLIFIVLSVIGAKVELPIYILYVYVFFHRNGTGIVPTLKVKVVTRGDVSTLTIPKVTVKQDGIYTCVAKNNIGQVVHEAKILVTGKYHMISTSPGLPWQQ